MHKLDKAIEHFGSASYKLGCMHAYWDIVYPTRDISDAHTVRILNETIGTWQEWRNAVTDLYLKMWSVYGD